MLEWYKPDQGHRSRGFTGITLGLLALHGCNSLYNFLSSSWWRTPLPGIGRVLGDEFSLEPRFLMALILGVLSAYGLFRMLNHPKVVDFLIETEAELKKVAWASRREVIGSSIVVLITVIILSLYIFGVDWLIIQFRGGEGTLFQIDWDAAWDWLLGPSS